MVMGEKRGMKALELWCKRVTDGYPGVKVENMTTSWRDGLAFCALIHRFRPDLIDFSSLKKTDVFSNNELAFRIGERHLGISALLDAEDMVQYEVPDRLSIMTYLSQFYQTFASHPSSPGKRSVESPDHSLVLSSPVPTPPPKEARRREPCFVCHLPVFLAQRLVVASHLYHRTCFRCARCLAQLTLANSYETQGGEYCCETCPDEEMAPQAIGDKGGGPPPSPLDIQHEDKTDSLVTARTASLVGLRRMMFDKTVPTETETFPNLRKLSDSKQSDREQVLPSRVSLSDNRPVYIGKNSSHRLSDTNFGKPNVSFVKNMSFNDNKDDSLCKYINNDDSGGKSDVIAIKCGRGSVEVSPSILSDVTISETDTMKVNEDQTFVMDCRENDFSCPYTILTSDIPEAVNTSFEFHAKLDVDSDSVNNSYSGDISIVDALNTSISNNDIESNVLVDSKESIETHLLEAKNIVLDDSINALNISSKSSIDDVTNIQQKTNIDVEIEFLNSPVGSIKEGTKTEKAKLNNFGNNNDERLGESIVIVRDEDIVEAIEASTKSYRDIINVDDEFISLSSNIEQLVIDAKNDDIISATSSEKQNTDNQNVGHNVVPIAIERNITYKPPTPQRRNFHKSSPKPKVQDTVKEYPHELNPFGDDSEEEGVEEEDFTLNSTNPFNSSDEDDIAPEEQELTVVPPTPAQRGTVAVSASNLNPFSSDGEEGDEEHLTPIPKLRNLGSTPKPQRLLRATGSIGSSTSIASRKKKPAPLPPNLQHLQAGCRKSYSAPQPPPLSRTATPSPPSSSPYSSSLTLEKDDKEFYNHRRQNSIVSESSSVGSYTPHKSTYGQWKRKKGPAPALPVPVRRTVAPVSLTAIRQELADIEVKQQGLESQGVRLEKTIRDNFNQEGTSLTPHIEEMVLQLFELVNEKNELFRRQAELMYMRRQHNLEVEHSDLEYQIRCLMLCPERNKTDSDKAREEQLIQRLVEVVERRNEIIDCLETDRLREKEEDHSVGTRLGIFSAAVGSEVDLRINNDMKTKNTKKEKKWIKKYVDKDVEEAGEKKKSKKKWFILHH